MTKKPFWPANNCVSVLAVAALVLLLGAILFPVFASSKGHGPTRCLSNIKQCDLGLQMYAGDHDDHLPPADAWMDCIVKYEATDEVLACPDVRGSNPKGYGYAMNIALSCKPIAKVPNPDEVVLIFDSVLLARNACSGFYGFPDPPRPSRNHVGFVDGHVQSLSPEELAAYGPDGTPIRPQH